jgi:hypothetical protein
MRKNWCIGAAACGVFAACGSSAMATLLTATASQGNLAASATFDVQGSNLVVTLTNTSLEDVLVPADVLTSVFFDFGSSLVLTPVSAVLDAGSVVHFGGTDPGGVVGGEWAYRAALAGAPHGAAYGISSSGLGLFGPADLFPGSDLSPPASPNGLNYGITSAGDDMATGNAAVTGSIPLIQNAVVFTLSGLPEGFDPTASIQNISFQYGTALTDPNLPTPAPTSGVIALGGALLLARRRR